MTTASISRNAHRTYGVSTAAATGMLALALVACGGGGAVDATSADVSTQLATLSTADKAILDQALTPGTFVE